MKLPVGYSSKAGHSTLGNAKRISLPCALLLITGAMLLEHNLFYV